MARRLVHSVRALRRVRCMLFEAIGSPRYSRTALYDLDRKLAPYLPASGVFVEAGANDGFRVSNTYYLERFCGWTGVLIEPIPALAAQCRKRRPRSRVYQCALVGEEHPEATDVVMRYAGMLSEVLVGGVQPPNLTPIWEKTYEVAVPARTLSDVLQDADTTQVDFLSLDVEGFEASVLTGLDFSRWAPRLMLIESRNDEAQRRVEAVLGPRYEAVDRLTAHDVLYRVHQQ